jgi:hypothetical protein
LVEEFSNLEAERKNLESRIKEARAVVGSASFQRYGEPSEPGSALAKEIVRQSPLKSYDSFKRRVLAALDDGRARIRGAIY